MVSIEPQDGITCRQAQLLMALHMKDDPDLTQAQRESFEAHLMACSAWHRANVREGIRSNVIFRQGYADGADGAPLRRWLGERRAPGVDPGIAVHGAGVPANDRLRHHSLRPAGLCRRLSAAVQPDVHPTSGRVSNNRVLGREVRVHGQHAA